MKDKDKSRADSLGTGAAEVTDEMIDVGADLISRHFYDVAPWPSSVRELASEVYRAMEQRRSQSRSAPAEQTGENLGPRASECPVAASRRGLALLRGPQGRVYSLALLELDQSYLRTAQASEPSREYQLFVLGIECLGLALAVIREQTTAFLRAR